ncbi:MAG: CoA transferase [Chloroflexi bacterium]|nr:CoA transferase [Chloroflexota bacterium]
MSTDGAAVGAPRGPLAGIRGIVLTQAWAGSYATQLLGMLGADIVQLEVRKRLDSWRGSYDTPLIAALSSVPTATHAWNCNPLYNSVNLNKRNATLDLATPAGVDLFRRLLVHADVVAENFSPRVLGNLGIDYEAMRAVKPDVILCSLTAYGHDGPWANVPGIGGTIEPTSGQSALLGYRDGPPINSGQMYPDAVAGLTGFAAMVTALRHRQRTGEGQYIDLSMQEANLAVVGDAALEYELTGRQRARLGNRHLTFAPHGIYPCLAAGRDQRWIALAAESETQWAALCAAAAHPDWLADPRFADNAARKTNEDALDAALAAWTATEDRDALAARLGTAGMIAAPVLDTLEVASDAHFRARGVIVYVDHPEVGRRAQPGAPVHFSRTPAAVTRHAPVQGEHNLEVFSELLGMTPGEYEALAAEGVTGVGEP